MPITIGVARIAQGFGRPFDETDEVVEEGRFDAGFHVVRFGGARHGRGTDNGCDYREAQAPSSPLPFRANHEMRFLRNGFLFRTATCFADRLPALDVTRARKRFRNEFKVVSREQILARPD